MTAVFLMALMVASGLASAQSSAGTTFTVTNTNDAGAGSLRQAITDANANANAPAQDTIAFNIPDTSCNAIFKVCTISPTSELPHITEPVTIDGYTQRPCSTNAAPCSHPNTKEQGTDADLLVQLSGASAGNAFGLFVSENTSNVVIRGLVLNGFGSSGIFVSGADNKVEGNFIGTNFAGSAATPNGISGVVINSRADRITIGGTDADDGTEDGVVEARNLISGNDDSGVEVSGSGPVGIKVQGNLIGTQKDGSQALGNQGHGVFARSIKDSGYSIGGKEAGAGNVIAHNGLDGVVPFLGTGVSILGNSIFSNGSTANDLGIDLGSNGVTPNDNKDADDGDNRLQNFPELNSATTSGSTSTITGTLNSRPRKTFTIQFFSNPTADTSGNGEGKTFLGEIQVKTSRKGNKNFSAPVSAPPIGENVITATATNKSTGDTSEFSNAVPIS